MPAAQFGLSARTNGAQPSWTMTQAFASRQCDTSQVTFTPASGTTYRIAVDGHGGTQGTIKLNLHTSSAAQPTCL